MSRRSKSQYLNLRTLIDAIELSNSLNHPEYEQVGIIACKTLEALKRAHKNIEKPEKVCKPAQKEE